MSEISVILSVGDLLIRKDTVVSVKIGDEENTISFSKDRVFFVPAYQREIRWQEKDVRTLVGDIKRGNKLLGNILLSTCDGINYEIIDGQQRITVLLMVLEFIKKKINMEYLDLCAYKNDTYEFFYDAMDFNYDKERIIKASKQEILNKDILEQTDSFKIIWDEIAVFIDKQTAEDILALYKNVLTSTINIIISKSAMGSVKEQFLVNFYLDINDRAVPLDSIDILKAYLFKYSYTVMTQQWAKNQAKIKNLRIKKIQYTVSTFYYHYISCSVNTYVDNKITKLPPTLKLTRTITLNNGNIYGKGTHIADIINNNGFYLRMMTDIEKCSDFMINVVTSVSYDRIKDYFQTAENVYVSDTALKNYHSMIKSILLNADVVPKILVMKYFIDVLSKKTAKEKEYQLIYYIYVSSVMFSACEIKKTSDKFLNMVLKKDFETEIKKCSLEYIKNRDKVIYHRETKLASGEVSETSGQYFPKQIFAVKYFFEISPNNTLKFDKGKLCDFLTDCEENAEHFFVNQSGKYVFHYGDTFEENGEKKKRCAEIMIPTKVKKYISYSGNYLIMNKDINKRIGNYTIVEKLRIIEDSGDVVFKNELVKKYFRKAQEIFLSGKYPKDLDTINDVDEAKNRVINYYEKDFSDEFKKYTEEISKI